MFADESGTSDQIIKQLQALNKTVVVAKKAAAFSKISEQVFELNTIHQDGADAVIEHVARNGKFQGIIFAWGLDSVSTDKLSEATIIQ